MRRSLLVRLSMLTMVVIVVAVAATAWLATLILNQGIRQVNRQSRDQVASVYRALLHYGATHRSWAGVSPLVDRLGRRAGLQIELNALSDRRLAFVRDGSRKAPAGSPVAIVDPLHVDPVLYPHAPASRIYPTASGPLRLSASDRAELDQLAESVLLCVRTKAGGGSVYVDAAGRPEVRSADPETGVKCGTTKLAMETFPDEMPALEALNELADLCLKSDHLPDIKLFPSFHWITATREGAGQRAATQRCLDAARREQLSASVAAPAVLYVSVPTRQRSALVLSSRNELHIAEITAAMIALALGATLLAGWRLVRPLRALTVAARGVEEHGFIEVVEVSGDDEIAHLTRAFNDMVRAQAQMQEQRKAAISDIAHELRTPLSTIRAWLEAARDGLTESDEQLVGSLLEEAMLLQRTVDDLQLLSLADSGQFGLDVEEVRLRPLLSQACAAPAATDVTIELDCPDLVVTVDPDRLRQVIQNLLSNSVRHSHRGASVQVLAVTEAGGLRIDVVDHGTGIAAADLPRVYDRFWRAEKSRNRTTGGSGLGLAIVRQLVEAHGGTVTARSIPDEETVFSVWLPIPVGSIGNPEADASLKRTPLRPMS